MDKRIVQVASLEVFELDFVQDIEVIHLHPQTVEVRHALPSPGMSVFMFLDSLAHQSHGTHKRRKTRIAVEKKEEGGNTIVPWVYGSVLDEGETEYVRENTAHLLVDQAHAGEVVLVEVRCGVAEKLVGDDNEVLD
jgi:hypothetical protein